MLETQLLLHVEPIQLLPHPGPGLWQVHNIRAFHIEMPSYFLLVERRIEGVLGGLGVSARFERSITG